MVLNGEQNRILSSDIAFTEENMQDYLSPEGNFPDEMYLAEELRNTPCRIPVGYTKQDTMNLLLAIISSDECLETESFTGSTPLSVVEDPGKDKLLIQLSMIVTNTFANVDFSRQKGSSEAFLKGREKLNELAEQIGRGDLTEVRRLVSSGIKNQLLLQKRFNRTIQAKREDYAGHRSMEMVLTVLKKHPELRDPKILSDQDMEDIRIAQGMAAYYNDFYEKSKKYIEKYEKGEVLSEDEAAELIFLNQVQGVSARDEAARENYLKEELLKETGIPGGIPMPIGQKYTDLNVQEYSMKLRGGAVIEELPFGDYLGEGQRVEFSSQRERKLYGLQTQEGYSNFTRAILYGYPQSRKKFIDKIKGSEFFKKLMENQAGIAQEYVQMAAVRKSYQEASEKKNLASKKLDQAKEAQRQAKKEKNEKLLREAEEARKLAEDEIKIRKAEYDEKNKAYQKKKDDLKANKTLAQIDGTEDQNFFTEGEIDRLLQEEGLAKKEQIYKGKTIPENQEYAEALEAQRQGTDLMQDPAWHSRIEKQRTQIAEKAKKLEKANAESKLYSSWSWRLRTEMQETDEKWIQDKISVLSYDPLMDLLQAYPGQAFTLDEQGNRKILNIAGTDPEEIRKSCLEAARNNGFYLMAPQDAESKSPIWCIELNEEDDSSLGAIQTLEAHRQKLEQVENQKREEFQELQKPSAWKRFWAFLIPGYRREINEYRKQQADLNKVSAAKSSLAGFIKKQSENIEKELDFDEISSETAQKYVEKNELENQKYYYIYHAERLKPEKIVAGLKDLIEGENSTEAFSPELALLSVIDSVASYRNGATMEGQIQYLNNLLYGNREEMTECVPALQESYRSLLDRQNKSEQPLLPVQKLRIFYETLMQKDTSIAACRKGAAILNSLGEEKLLNVIGSKNSFPSEVRGLMRYGEIARSGMEICRRETDKALQDARAAQATQAAQVAPSKEDVATVLLMDALEKEHILGNNLTRNPKNHLLYTPMLRELGKCGIQKLQKEFTETVGEDRLNTYVSRGSEDFVMNYRGTGQLPIKEVQHPQDQAPQKELQKKEQKTAAPQK